MAYNAGTAYLDVTVNFKTIERQLAQAARKLARGFDAELNKAMPQSFGPTEKDVRRANDQILKARQDLAKDLDTQRNKSTAAELKDYEKSLKQRTTLFQRYTDIQAGLEKAKSDPSRQSAQDLKAYERGLQDRAKAHEAALKEDYLRERRARDDIRKLHDDAIKEQEQQERQLLGERAKAHEAALKEDHLRERKALDARGRLYDDALKEDYLRERRARDQIRKLHDDALKENEQQERRAAQRIADAHDAAVKEDYLRQVRARDQIRKLYDDAIKEQEQQERRAVAEHEKLYDAAVKEDYLREKRALAARDQLHEEALKQDFLRDRRLQEARDNAIRAQFDEFATNRERARQANLDLVRMEIRDRERLLGQERQRQQAQDRRDLAARQATRARSFGGRVQGALQSASAGIVEIPVRLDDRSARAELERLRAQMARLGGLDLDVNIDVVLDDVEAQFARLRALAHDRDVEIDVRLDAAGAATELGGILALANRIDREDAKVDVEVDVDRGLAALAGLASNLNVNLSRFQSLILLGAALGSAIVPAAAVATSAIGALGTAALAAGAGIGVMILGFSGVSDAVKALDGAANAQKKTNKSLVSSENQVASALDGVKSAERSLAATRIDNREAAVDAYHAVQQATRDVADAQLDLNETYRKARTAFEDLRSSIEGNAISQRQAILDVKQAKEELDKLRSSKRATADEREQADITYQRAKLQLKDLKVTRKDLDYQQKQNDRTGVAGSKMVRDAQEKLRDTQEKLATAERNQERQRRRANDAMLSAQQGLVSAQRGLQNATVSSSTAGGAALDKLNQSMSALSPTAQRFARFIYGLKPAFLELRGAASDGMLDGAMRAINLFIPAAKEGETRAQRLSRGLKPITDFVRKVSDKLGELFVRLGQTLKDPVFQRFFGYIRDTALPTMDKWFTIISNVTEGLVGLFLNFTPLTDDVTDGFVNMSESFKRWATTLDRNNGFQLFLQYVRDNMPVITDLFDKALRFVGKLIVAMAPIGPVVVRVLTKLFDVLDSIPASTWTVIIAGLGVFAVVLAAIGAGGAIAAIGTTAVVVAAVAAGIAALAIGAVVLLNRSKPLRDFFVNLWNTVRDATVRMWAVVGPALTEFGMTMQKLWKDWTLPAIQGIWEVLKATWPIVKPIFDLIITIIKTVGGVVWWLFKNVFNPVFKAIVWLLTEVVAPVVRWLWSNVFKPVFASIGVMWSVFAAVAKVAIGLVLIVLKVLGKGFMWLWDHVLSPLWENHLKPFFTWIGAIWKEHVQPHWDKAMKALKDTWADFVNSAKEPVRFLIETVMNNGMLKAYNKLAELFDVEPKNVHIDMPEFFQGPKASFTGSAKGHAAGGVLDVLPGYTPGRDVHRFVSASGGAIDLSGGEGILRPELTRLVRPWLDQGNAAARRGGRQGVERWLGGYRSGGVIPGGHKEARGGIDSWWDALRSKASDVFDSFTDLTSNPAGYLRGLGDKLLGLVPKAGSSIIKVLAGGPKKILDGLVNKVTGLLTGGDDSSGGNGTPGSAGGLGGSAGMIKILRAVFPGLPLNSGFRPGAITAGTHRASLHSINRAVDVPPRMDVFNWIHDNFPNSRELIFTPAGNRQLYHGQPHVYSGITAQMHRNHLHWGYDEGGWLPDTRQMPGRTMQVFHGRKKPDAVLSNEQWSNVATLVRNTQSGNTGGATYNTFDFERSTLTPERLQNIQARQDMVNRVNRDNW